MSTPTCTNCGLPNAPNATACARCGAPLAGAPPSANWAPPSPAYAPAAPKGRSTAVTVAIVLACVVVVGLIFVGIVAAIAIPSLLRARAAANESAAIGTLRMISSAEATYASSHGGYGKLRDLVRDSLVEPGLEDGVTRNGYRFHEVKVTDDAFEFSAEPVDSATAGARSYNVTDDFMIRYREGSTAPRGISGTVLGN